MLAERADVGFVEAPELVPDELDAQVVARDQLTVVVAPDHPWARRRQGIDAARLAITPLVAREHGSGTRGSWSTRWPSGESGRSPSPSSSWPRRRRSRTRRPTGWRPRCSARWPSPRTSPPAPLVAVPVRGVALDRTLSAVWPRGRPLTGPSEDLVRIATGSG